MVPLRGIWARRGLGAKRGFMGDNVRFSSQVALHELWLHGAGSNVFPSNQGLVDTQALVGKGVPSREDDGVGEKGANALVLTGGLSQSRSRRGQLQERGLLFSPISPPHYYLHPGIRRHFTWKYMMSHHASLPHSWSLRCFGVAQLSHCVFQGSWGLLRP